MAQQRVVVVGGGPAGLLAARLLAVGGFDVTVHERLDPAETYGFGVALAGKALGLLRELDPTAAERVTNACHPLPTWTIRRGTETATVGEHGSYGVERSGLLRTLQGLALEAGARIENGSDAKLDAAAEQGDVVVLAEGAGSLGREALGDRFGADVATIPTPYMWCGANLDLPSMVLDLRQTEDGIFCGHVMPYGGGRCTFQVDAEPAVIAAAGLSLHEGEGNDSDEASLKHLGNVFADLLGGRALLGNRSRWSTFRLVTCDRWSSGKFVLLGDAAHTAHYTVGSGTRMAMEDAIVFSQALAGEASTGAAFESYERARRPAVEHLQWRAERSQTWWRTLAHRYELPLPRLMLSYFTRTGGVTLATLARTNPDLVAEVTDEQHLPAALGSQNGVQAEQLSDDASRRVLGGRIMDWQRLNGDTAEVACDALAPWSSATQELAQRAASGQLGGGLGGIVLTGDDGQPAVLDRFDVAEELRAAGAATVAVSVPATSLADSATALAAGRADYIVVER